MPGLLQFKWEAVSIRDFKVERVEVPVIEDGEEVTLRMLKVTCPRADCRGEHFVRLRWKKLRQTGTLIFITKSCPYCFRVSRVPERYWPRWVRNRYSVVDKERRETFQQMFKPKEED